MNKFILAKINFKLQIILLNNLINLNENYRNFSFKKLFEEEISGPRGPKYQMQGTLGQLSRKRIAFSFDHVRRQKANEEKAMSSLAVEKASSVTGYCYFKLHAVVCSFRVLFVTGCTH